MEYPGFRTCMRMLQDTLQASSKYETRHWRRTLLLKCKICSRKAGRMLLRAKSLLYGHVSLTGVPVSGTTASTGGCTRMGRWESLNNTCTSTGVSVCLRSGRQNPYVLYMYRASYIYIIILLRYLGLVRYDVLFLA